MRAIQKWLWHPLCWLLESSVLKIGPRRKQSVQPSSIKAITTDSRNKHGSGDNVFARNTRSRIQGTVLGTTLCIFYT